MQAWEMYKSEKLGNLVQLDPNSKRSRKLLEDLEEAVRFLKIGLLCVQENSRLRPIMSNALRMMQKQINIDDIEISSPALINNIMDVKIAKNKSTSSLHDQTNINIVQSS